MTSLQSLLSSYSHPHCVHIYDYCFMASIIYDQKTLDSAIANFRLSSRDVIKGIAPHVLDDQCTQMRVMHQKRRTMSSVRLRRRANSSNTASYISAGQMDSAGLTAWHRSPLVESLHYGPSYESQGNVELHLI